MRVSQYMTRKLITGKPDDGVRDTLFLLRREHIRHLPVIDGTRAVRRIRR